ncbi:inositol monophosphatase family protein [Myxacorys almedinensis]|uniref:Inositol monophosphatase n=1 Tax=Myxacorys almedinensis A TaxID=2690445 RepID=A0A8J7YW41_9CYAN|nr:inositol monophosphatase family protein [Myxacorys almedinensis]NDJ15689.1 inositol monophosphatase [Myxacorys almedinensis A]
MPDFWTTIQSFAESTTHRIGTQLLKDVGHATASEKADGSLVTQSDRWADAELRRAIAHTFPDHGVLSEEVEHIFPDTEWCWIIDPIDGTTNFARGLPLWGISLGLLYRGTPVFGYVYLPPIQQSFHGFWRGTSDLAMPSGAFLNNAPIRASQAALSHHEFFNICARSVSLLKSPFPAKIRILGVATYNLLSVGAGITLGSVEATPKIWDIAAVWVIVQAAGAVWHSLESEASEPMFPLTVGNDYTERSFPTLVVSYLDLIPIFEPLVKSVAQQT